MKQLCWTRPELVAQLQFVEWTAENRLRLPKFLGLRSGKEAKDVHREP
jgi:bifunctional non-homologous end joining protein LigD